MFLLRSVTQKKSNGLTHHHCREGPDVLGEGSAEGVGRAVDLRHGQGLVVAAQEEGGGGVGELLGQAAHDDGNGVGAAVAVVSTPPAWKQRGKVVKDNPERLIYVFRYIQVFCFIIKLKAFTP